MKKTEIYEIDYPRVGKCLCISDGYKELIVTTQFGPRVIRFGVEGGVNMFCDDGEMEVMTPVDETPWRIYGGHRLWHSPEYKPRTYIPDNDAPEYMVKDNGIHIVSKTEPWTNVQKVVDITFEKDGAVRVEHTLVNKGAWAIEIAVWPSSVMARGGVEVVPQPDRATGLLSNRILTLWPYTDMADDRVVWGSRYIFLRQDEHKVAPIKFGINNEKGWAAYFLAGCAFVKTYAHDIDALYPDGGVSYETYTTDYMLEMETLSPLTSLQPEASVTHTEYWRLYDGVNAPLDEDGAAEFERKYIAK